MPRYVFECQTEECNTRFEKMLKMGDWPTYPCPSCKEVAPRCLQGEGISFGFQVEPAKEGNSGVHKEDYPTADQAVGRSASRRWESYQARKKVKDGVRQQGGTHALIRRDGGTFVEYEGMTKEGLDDRKTRAKTTFAALRAAKEAKEAAKKTKACCGGHPQRPTPEFRPRPTLVYQIPSIQVTHGTRPIHQLRSPGSLHPHPHRCERHEHRGWSSDPRCHCSRAGRADPERRRDCPRQLLDDRHADHQRGCKPRMGGQLDEPSEPHSGRSGWHAYHVQGAQLSHRRWAGYWQGYQRHAHGDCHGQRGAGFSWSGERPKGLDHASGSDATDRRCPSDVLFPPWGHELHG